MYAWLPSDRISKVVEFAVLCPLSCITSNFFLSRKVGSKQDKQFKPLYIYNSVGLMYNIIIQFCSLFKTLKNIYQMKNFYPASHLIYHPTNCASQDGFGQTWWTGSMTAPLQFASLYDGQEVFVWSDGLLDLGADFLEKQGSNHQLVEIVLR